MGDIDRQQTTRKGKKPRIVVEDLEKGQKSYVVTMADARMAVIALSGGKTVSPYAIKNAMHRGDVLLGRFRVYNIGQKTRLTKDTKPIPKGKRRLRIKKRLDPKSTAGVQSFVNVVSNLSSATESVNNAQPNLAKDAGIPVQKPTESTEPVSESIVPLSTDADARSVQDSVRSAEEMLSQAGRLDGDSVQLDEEGMRIISRIIQSVPPSSIPEVLREIVNNRSIDTQMQVPMENGSSQAERVQVPTDGRTFHIWNGSEFVHPTSFLNQRFNTGRTFREDVVDALSELITTQYMDTSTDGTPLALTLGESGVEVRNKRRFFRGQTGDIVTRASEIADSEYEPRAKRARQEEVEPTLEDRAETQPQPIGLPVPPGMSMDPGLPLPPGMSMDPGLPLPPGMSMDTPGTEAAPQEEAMYVPEDERARAQRDDELRQLIRNVSDRENRLRTELGDSLTEEQSRRFSEIRQKIARLQGLDEEEQLANYNEEKTFFDEAARYLGTISPKREREDEVMETPTEPPEKKQAGDNPLMVDEGAVDTPVPMPRPVISGPESDSPFSNIPTEGTTEAEELDDLLDASTSPEISSADEYLEKLLDIFKRKKTETLKLSEIEMPPVATGGAEDIVASAMGILENPVIGATEASRLFTVFEEGQEIFYVDARKMVELIDEIGQENYLFLLFSYVQEVIPAYKFDHLKNMIYKASGDRIDLDRAVTGILEASSTASLQLSGAYRFPKSDIDESRRGALTGVGYFEYRMRYSNDIMVQPRGESDYVYNFSQFRRDTQRGAAQRTPDENLVRTFTSKKQNNKILANYIPLLQTRGFGMEGSGLLDTQGVSAEMGTPQIKTSEGILDEIAVLHSGHVNKRARSNLMQEDIKLVDSNLGTRAVGKQTMKTLYDNFRRPHSRDEDNSMPSDEYRAATKVPYRTRARTVSRNVNGLPIGNQVADFDVEMTPQGAVLRSRANPFYTVPISSTTGRQYLLQRRPLAQVIPQGGVREQPQKQPERTSVEEPEEETETPAEPAESTPEFSMPTEPMEETETKEEDPDNLQEEKEEVEPEISTSDLRERLNNLSAPSLEQRLRNLREQPSDEPTSSFEDLQARLQGVQGEATLEGTGIRGTKRVLNRIRPRVHAPN